MLILGVIAFIFIATLLIYLVLSAWRRQRQRININEQNQALIDRLNELEHKRSQAEHQLLSTLLEKQSNQTQLLSEKLSQSQLKNLELINDNLAKGRTETSQFLHQSLARQNTELGNRLDKLTETTQKRLKEISTEVENRLTKGFEKSTAIFADIMQRLSLIDQAQKKISQLSGDVVSLHSILADKRSRGAFGEVQLTALIRNVMPTNSFAFQHTLSNNRRADCILFLPKPTGHVVIDSKFPLENYQKFTDQQSTEHESKQAQSQFKRDVKKHIDDIAQKYIIPGETSDGAIMFIPAEAIFAEIHAHHGDLVEHSYRQKVWLASPTTMMAILSTTRAVLKDDATVKQVHVIQKHLRGLSDDFTRFQKRMDTLERHIQQANDDVQSVNISAKKITRQFGQIDQVDLEEPEPTSLLREPTKDTTTS